MTNTHTVADIFKKSASTDEFRTVVRSLHGRFSLSAESIQALGEAYLERFPGCYGNEDCDDVRDAYEVAKICIIEHLLSRVDEKFRPHIHAAFSNVSAIENEMNALRLSIGPAGFASLIGMLTRNMEAVQAMIESLPAGIIKERFSGALAYARNIVYLMGLDGGIA